MLTDIPQTKRPTVLLIENDPEARTLLKQDLEDAGYQPLVATDKGTHLFDQAKQLARTHQCLLAIVDMRALSDLNPTDTSGIDCAEELQKEGVTPLVWTAYQENRDTRRRLTELGIETVGKEEHPRVLEERLQKLAARSYALCSSIQIHWGEGARLAAEGFLQRLEHQRRAVGEGHDTPIRFSLLEDMLVQLYPDAHALEIPDHFHSVPSSGRSGPTPRGNSLVLLVRKDGHNPEVVKVAQSEIIRQESENFRDYVGGRLDATTYTQWLGQKCLWSLGAVHYTLVGAEAAWRGPQLLSELYADLEASWDPVATFAFLFKGMFGRYYREQVQVGYGSLFRAYAERWTAASGHGSLGWEERIRQQAADADSVDTPFLVRPLKHPTEWLAKKVGLVGECRDTSFFEIYTVVTHGDLHSRNVLVELPNRCWLIDFERTGPGPRLRDFVELEVDIVTHLAHFNMDDRQQAELFAQLACLLADKWDLPESPHAALMGAARRAYNTVRALRDCAKELVRSFDHREYWWGLLLNSVYLLTRSRMAEEAFSHERQRATLYGALLCKRLSSKSTSVKRLLHTPLGLTITDPARLRAKMVETLALEELKTLAFDLGINHNNLATRHEALARELGDEVAARGLVGKLRAWLQQQRPHVSWSHYFSE